MIWLGHRRVDCRAHPDRPAVWPVRVAAGAFAPRVPERDLFLSPDHAVFLGGALIPIRYLVNDATIRQQPVDEVTYWHVELPRHDVVFAEGAAAESFLDTGNRSAFENGGKATMLHPDFALRIWESEACATLVVAGPELEALRGRLLDRAVCLGYRVTGEPKLCVMVAGQAIAPRVSGRIHRFELPEGGGRIRLASRSAVPAHVLAASGDNRRLGVAVAAVVLDGRRIPCAEACRGQGWHGAEPGWHWTDGDAALSVGDARVLEVDVALTMPSWLAPHTAGERAA